MALLRELSAGCFWCTKIRRITHPGWPPLNCSHRSAIRHRKLRRTRSVFSWLSRRISPWSWSQPASLPPERLEVLWDVSIGTAHGAMIVERPGDDTATMLLYQWNCLTTYANRALISAYTKAQYPLDLWERRTSGRKTTDGNALL